MLHDKTKLTTENVTPENLARWHDHKQTRKDDKAAALIRELWGAATLLAMENTSAVEHINTVRAAQLATWHERESRASMNQLHCGSENWEYRAAGRAADKHDAATKIVRALKRAADARGMEY